MEKRLIIFLSKWAVVHRIRVHSYTKTRKHIFYESDPRTKPPLPFDRQSTLVLNFPECGNSDRGRETKRRDDALRIINFFPGPSLHLGEGGEHLPPNLIVLSFLFSPHNNHEVMD